MIHRSFDAQFFNRVVNDPAVHRYASLGLISGPLDVTELVLDPNNYLLATEHGGFLGIDRGNGTYEVHTMFLPEGRGKEVKEAAHEAVRYMFTLTPCDRLITHVTLDNRPAELMAKWLGFSFVRNEMILGIELKLYELRRQSCRLLYQ